MFPNGSNREAIVLGASLGGLLTARVLANHFDRVTLVERDPVRHYPEARKGQPQTRHLHGLLVSGFKVLTTYFPDLPTALSDGGALVVDFAEGMHWYTCGGYRKTFHFGAPATAASRPFLEHLVRERVLALPNVCLLDNSAAKQLITSSDRTAVTGVVVEHRESGLPPSTLAADLVVDVTGRGSRTPQWLKELGYGAPPESEVKVDIGYATRIYRRNLEHPLNKSWILNTPDAPRETRFGGAFPIEGERWIVSTGGWHGDHPPTEEASFTEFIKGLPSRDVYNVVSTSEPLGDIVAHKLPSSLRRHYDRVNRFPEGFLVLGDAVASFNPTYGQGMTSAALQAAALDEILKLQPKPDALAAAFFKRAARIVDIPWQLAVGEDFRFPQTTGPKPAGTDMINRYVSRVHRATLRDSAVCGAFLKVMNLMAPPTSLFAPATMRRVMMA